MADDTEHSIWEASSKACESAPGAQGCICRHSLTKALLSTPCDYQWNSFEICKAARCAPYELNVRAGKPYLEVLRSMEGNPRAEVLAKRASQGKSNGYQFFQLNFGSPAKMLEADPLAWNINHTVAPQNLPKWARKRWGGSSAENFKPAAHGGMGARIPYHHNHHHLIPNGAFRDAVILGEGLGKTAGSRELSAYWRICIVRLSKYNLNEKENVCILPQEVHVSKVVGLPAHCPYGVRDHLAYSNMVKSELGRVRDTIDNAIGEAAEHEALQEVKIVLTGLEQALWSRIQLIEPIGAAIGTKK